MPEARESVVVAMTRGQHTGWGEVSLGVAPRRSREWARGAFACTRDWLAPAVVGRAIESGEQLHEALSEFTGNEGAKAALDIAWWNLQAAEKGEPLHARLGAQCRPVALGIRLPQMATIEALLAEIQRALDQGYRTISLEFRPGWDLEMLRAVRQTFPDAPLAVDCDGCCSLGQQEMLYRLEDFFLEAIEQPLPADDLVGHAMLQANLRTPIMLDQSIVSPAHVEQAADLESCRAVRVNPARVGGLTPAVAIHAACQAAQIPCAVGAADAGILERAATLALATLPGFSLAAEVSLAIGVPSWLSAAPALSADASGGDLAFLPSPEVGEGVAIDVDALMHAALDRAMVG